MVWVLRHSPLVGVDKVILLGIANHADDEGGNAWPSVATLSRYANVTERSVQRSLKRMAAEGHITVRRQRGGTADTSPDRRPNLYTVVMSGVTAASPRLQVDTPRDDAGVANGVTHVSPEPSIEPSIRDAAAPRPRNELWDAVVDVCGWTGRTLTRSEQGRVAKAVKELKEVDARPEDVTARARKYRKEWPDVELTPQALVANWNRFAAKGDVQGQPTCKCGQRLDDHDEQVCLLLGGRDA
jgi:hypothetical protein